MEFNSGATYNNFIYSDIEDGEVNNDKWVREELNEGRGHYFEGTYWLNNRVGLGLGYQKSISTWDSIEYYDEESYRDFRSDYNLSSSYGRLAYRLNNNVNLDLALGNYSYSEDYYADYSWLEKDSNKKVLIGEGYGYRVGKEVNHNLSERLSLNTKAFYQQAKINLLESYDNDKGSLIEIEEDKVLGISGLGISLGVSYRF
ncbi:hypothetical protein [Halonatronum saccharophilum]|uniref:hypothetical protein n=1 Tax=Halonatronum saccharophilum TaxID=150060 RepID=UPI00146F9B12|nr:hypothetical protein [Halonatronum saccharophilum]